MREHRPCAAIKRDGTPCTGRALPGSDYCFAHDPARQEALAASRVRGGQGKATAARLGKLVPTSLRPVLATLFDTLAETKDGKMDPRQATAIATVARAVVSVYQVGVIEERVQALEEAQAGQERRAG